MTIDVRVATTPSERVGVYRFRYDMYCRQQGLFHDVADHDRGELSDDDDDGSTLIYAIDGDDGDAVVGTLRVTWAGDGYSDHLARELQLDRVLAVADPAVVALLGRFIVAPHLRGGDVSSLMILAAADEALHRRTEIVVGDCEPHLLAYYRTLGFRPFGHLTSHKTSLLIPLTLLVGDRSYLRTIGSPVVHLFPEDHCPPPSNEVLAILDHAATARVPLEEGQAAVQRVLDRAARPPTLFQGLGDEERELLFQDAVVLDLRAGDLVIGEGTSTRTLYAVLEGVVEVTRGDHLVATAVAGDVVGELAMLLDRDRTAAVRAATDASVLALSDRALSRLVERSPELAAGVLWNLARVLAFKLSDVSAGTE